MNDPEAAGIVEHSISEADREHTEERLDLDLLDLPVKIARLRVIQSCTVQWIIETSTDMDNIAAAAGMIPEIEWLATEGVTDMLCRLTRHFYAYFDPAQHILPLAQVQAVASLKAILIHHCSVEQS